MAKKSNLVRAPSKKARFDPLSPMERSERMRSVKGKDTAPERVVRKLVDSMGYRYRLHARKLPGRPDIVFPSRHKVLFIHGCFWHRHRCASGVRIPRTRLDFWLPKLENNRKRDRRKIAALKRDGWDVLIVWECQLRNGMKLKEKIKGFLRSKK